MEFLQVKIAKSKRQALQGSQLHRVMSRKCQELADEDPFGPKAGPLDVVMICRCNARITPCSPGAPSRIL